jgi:hypothetical protein
MRPHDSQQQDDLVFLEGGIDRVPAELNIKRNSNLIFPHHRVKNLDKERVFHIGNGKLIISPAVKEKAPTTSSLRVFIALLALAQAKKTETNCIPFSAREIAHVLRVSMTGEFAARLWREFRSLSMTTFEWQGSFQTPTGTRTTLENFHLINSIRYSHIKERRENKTQFAADGVAEINSNIFNNIKAGVISFVILETLISFKSSLSEAFYLRVDTILGMGEYATKPLELKSETVIQALQLDDVKEYRKVSIRKRVLDAIAKECSGKTLSNDNTLNVQLAPTAGGKDWKLLCSQTVAKAHAPRQLPPPVANGDPALVEYLADLITEATGQPQHRRYHLLVARHYKEPLIREAIALLKQEAPANMRDRGAVFTTKLKSIVRRARLPWIRPEGEAA